MQKESVGSTDEDFNIVRLGYDGAAVETEEGTKAVDVFLFL